VPGKRLAGTAGFFRPDFAGAGKVPSAGRSYIIYSCSTTCSRKSTTAETAIFFGSFRLGVQNKAITAAVQPAPHIRAPAAIIDLIAVADLEAWFGAIPPDGAGDEPRKRLRKRWIEPAGIDGAGNINKNVSAATWPIAGRPVRMASLKSVQDSGSMKEIVDEGIDDNKTRADSEPTRPDSPNPEQQ
jgi:hypothetical protein